MTVKFPRSFLTFLMVLVWTSRAADIARPEFNIYQARAKQHRRGAEGKLVEGEEHLRKIILGWYRIDGAEAYEICHQCVGRIDENTGVEIDDSIGTIRRGGEITTCGGQPCTVLPAAPIGYNRFHLRYQTKDGDWSSWSKVKNYKVEDVGHLEHEELKVEDAEYSEHEEL
mmetsp:Transcript_23005/g.33953  ORF Transcript_23005/g.33953 Transcript_23005/m.33953 type:complete len:170 (-) Transcript_23005:64-573(-)